MATIDLAQAITKINPAATYRLNHSQADGNQEIVEWRGPGTEPTTAELAAAWAQVEADQATAEAERAAIEAKISAGKTEVNATDFDAMQKAAQTAKDLAALKAVVSNVILALARLSEAEGMTPVTPAAEATP